MNATRLGGLLAPAACNARQLKFVAGFPVPPLRSGLSGTPSNVAK